MRVAPRLPQVSKNAGQRLSGKRTRPLRRLKPPWPSPQQCNPLSRTRTKAPRPSTSEPLCFVRRTRSFPLDGHCRDGQSRSDLRNPRNYKRDSTQSRNPNINESTWMKAEENDVPQFGSPFSELANGRKLTDEEL